MTSEFAKIFGHYTKVCRPTKVIELEYFSGLSGRVYCKIQSENDEVFCLRRYRNDPHKIPQLQFVQSVLWMADCEGANWLPLPFETDDQKGYITEDGAVWELLPWFAGSKVPIGKPLSPQSLRSVFECVAEFHRITKAFPVPNAVLGLSPQVLKRLQEWRRWVRTKIAELDAAIQNTTLNIVTLPEYSGFSPLDKSLIVSEMLDAAQKLIRVAIKHSGHLVSLLSRAARIAVPHQPVLQSLYRRHLIFDDAQQHLNGLVHCSEMGIDSIAVDLAMLLAHLSPWESPGTLQSIADYRKITDISDQEHYLMVALYHAETIMHSLDRLAMLFLPSERDFLETPNVAHIAMIRDELQWAITQISVWSENV